MAKEILINCSPQESRIALLQDKKVVELFFERNSDKGIVGNIYKGKVVRVLPGMQAAFVDIGHERAAFLYAGDFYKSKQNMPEDVDDEDEEVETSSRGGPRRRRRGMEDVPPIAQLVREGQEILVQVAKGPIGTKGARLTCHLSLPGRNLVFMPTLKHNGVSRKIDSFEVRKRLKKIIDQYRSRDGGFIVRTAASGGTNERQIRSDVDYLQNLWKKIQRKYQTSGAPALLHYDLDLTTRVIRDFLEDDIDRMIVDSESEHRRILRFIRNFNPELRDKVELYEDTSPLFDRYHVEAEIQKALSKRVWLKSGGYLIIETTEALTSIDVNTGRFVGKKTLEETILRTNMEAAEEIVKQLRLRNIGGIIIIDFIDMERDSSKEQVYRFLENCLKEDKNKTTILKISNLGLVEMTRKRSRESIQRYLTESCPTCEGKGFVKSVVSLAHQVIRDVRREMPSLEEDHLYISVHPEVYAYLNENEEKAIVAIEKQYQKGIRLISEPAFHWEQVALSPREPGKVRTLSPAKASSQMDALAHKHSHLEEDDEDDSAAYQADVQAIHDVKEAKRMKEAEIKRAAEAAAAARLAADAADDAAENDLADDGLSEGDDLEAPVIRSREEAEATDVEEADDADEDAEDEITETDAPTEPAKTSAS